MKIDKKIITNLREEYGDAFYLLDSEQFQKNFIELRDTFRSIYPNFNIAYSYKTNYTPKFCKLVDKMGGYAEVVSEMEMEIVALSTIASFGMDLSRIHRSLRSFL